MSGAPGYRRGQPILGGKKIAFEDKKAILQSISGINMYKGLNCEQREAQAITFDQDTVIACRLQLTKSELEKACSPNFDFNVLTDSEIPTHIGRYGDANFHFIDDWVEIQTSESRSAPAWNDASLTCHDISSVVQYDIIIAKSGSVFNEQWKIVGVHRYRKAQTWKFDRSSTTTTNYYLQWRVRFIRHPSQSTSQRLSPIPNFLPTLPSDVLYPFSIAIGASSPSHDRDYWITATSIALVLTILQQLLLLV